MAQVYYGCGYVYSIQYHIVWCVKYRHKILISSIETRLKEILYKIAEDNGFTIVLMNGDLDHIHLLIECTYATIYSRYNESIKRSISENIDERIWNNNKEEIMGRAFVEFFVFCSNSK